jgi:hypothetical protein
MYYPLDLAVEEVALDAGLGVKLNCGQAGNFLSASDK